MAKFELKLPKMGESVAEATITTWLKNVGDTIEMDEAVLEIATDKVDTEVPCEFEGVLLEKCYEVDDVVQVGQTIAIIEVSHENESEIIEDFNPIKVIDSEIENSKELVDINENSSADFDENTIDFSDDKRFYSPLVKSIIKKEGIELKELKNVPGSGKNNRINKNDILSFIKSRNQTNTSTFDLDEINNSPNVDYSSQSIISQDDEIVQMSRMGKLISKHMQDSIKESAHVQSFIEVDVTNIWNWRNRVKGDFLRREGEKLTLTPIFMQAVAVALRTHPMMNISVKSDQIIIKKNINLGMATSLSDGNLIVPVIKNADRLNLVGMTKSVNDLANRARNGKLNPDDIQQGTYTVTNVGVFGSIMGTPIINQPQVGILAL
ncbi:MAG: 2-oxo acid dehydrogenase subunit E2, partial [Flavobacteriaceae bacterium]|nr:2-oxo acid dehydrogenase subunit E2 [Flavobacteriaceae bacterium]